MSAFSMMLLAFCIAAEVAREICFKRAVDNDEEKSENQGILRMVLTTPLLWLGIAFWMAEMTAWVFVLGAVPLNIAFPIMSLVYAGVPLASHWLLGERINRKQWGAAAIIVFGVLLVGSTGV